MNQNGKVYEVTGCGFRGDIDVTDNRVYWVRTSDVLKLKMICGRNRANFCEELPDGLALESDIDFDLPEQEVGLFNRLTWDMLHPPQQQRAKHGQGY